MSLIDHGERFPLVSYFGTKKQKVINGNVSPHRDSEVVIDILDFMLPNAEDPTAPTSQKIAITAICCKYFPHVRRRTFTSAQLIAAETLPYQQSITSTATRILAGTLDKVPETRPPAFSSSVGAESSPLLRPPTDVRNIVFPGPTIWPRNVNNPQYSLWYDEVFDFDMILGPDVFGTSTSRSSQAQTKRGSFQATHLNIPVEFGTYYSEDYEMNVPYPMCPQHPFIKIHADVPAPEYPLTPMINVPYQISVVYHEVSGTPFIMYDPPSPGIP